MMLFIFGVKELGAISWDYRIVVAEHLNAAKQLLANLFSSEEHVEISVRGELNPELPCGWRVLCWELVNDSSPTEVIALLATNNVTSKCFPHELLTSGEKDGAP